MGMNDTVPQTQTKQTNAINILYSNDTPYAIIKQYNCLKGITQP